MRMGCLWLGPVTLFVLAAVCTRRQLFELSRVVQTYTSFYPYLDTHPDVLLRYPSQAGNASTASPAGESERSTTHIPSHLHQIHLQEGRPSVLEKHANAIRSCRDVHPGWNHTIWTDAMGESFMRQNYPKLYPHYIGYKQSIQRANILRYALLDHFGGVYLDLDVTCRQNLEHLRHLPWLTPGAHPAGVNNAFILSRPHHPFLKHLLDAVPSRDLAWYFPYIENMLSTGCMFFSNMWMSYAREREGQGRKETQSAVFVLADEQGDLEPHMLRGVVTTPLFRHGGASSWHGWDAAVIVMIGKYYTYLLPTALGSLLALAWCAWKFGGRRVWRRRRSWDLGVKRALSPSTARDRSRMPVGKARMEA